MENLKIRVNSADESKEAQGYFEDLGAVCCSGLERNKNVNFLFMESGFLTACKLQENFDKSKCKEITLPELRAMANPMKEYLEPLQNGEYKYHSNASAVGGEWIRIPEGMNFAYKDDMYTHFTKMEMGYRDAVIIWQRDQDQDEPFLTPECSLNDQYAEIEQVRQVEIHGTVKAEPDLNFEAAQAAGGVDATLAQRQSTYGNFEDVAFVTENIMSILAQVRVNGLNDFPNTHRMALYMIASKMARIVNGDFNHLDSWHDIGGYSKLIEKLIKGE